MDTQQQLTLDVTGMTCASCVGRVERALNKVDGVEASVNLATEQAHLSLADGVSVESLIAAVEDQGYHASVHADARRASTDDTAAAPDPQQAALAQLRQRVIVSAWLTVPVVLLSMVPALQFTHWQWLALTLASPVVVWGGWPFHRSAWLNLRHGTMTMDTLVSLGTIASFAWSLYALFLGGAGDMPAMHEWPWQASTMSPGHSIYLEAAAGVTTLVLAGRYAERRARRQAGEALRQLIALAPQQVTVLRGAQDAPVTIAADSLQVGERFVVAPGEPIATDGVVESGVTAIDTQAVTGETQPTRVGVGDAVVGATVNLEQRIVVRATAVGEQTQLGQMVHLVEQAQAGKAPVQRMVDRVSQVFVPVVLVLSVITLIAWLVLTGDPPRSFSAAVAVLIIACPCALGLATPTALLVGTSRAAQLGILIRGPQVLETTRTVDTVVFDKTGTLTTGRMRVADTHLADPAERAQVWRAVLALEAGTGHPVGQALITHARDVLGDDATVAQVDDRTVLAGLGVRGSVDGQAVLVASPRGFDEAWQRDADDFAQTEAMTEVWVGWGGRVRAGIGLTDDVRESAAGAVRELQQAGLNVILLSGDRQPAAEAVGRRLGIAAGQVRAEVAPADKARVIAELQQAGHHVAMVGDGINDAAALAQADLGIALASGTDIAIESADITVLTDDLAQVPRALRLSKRTLGTIRGNLFWAFAYNVAAIPLAAFGLLTPMVAGAAMAFSSVFVVGNSLLLRRVR